MRILEGPKIRQQALARAFVERFRELEQVRSRDLDWRGWIERYGEFVQWDIDLAAAGEMGLYGSLRSLYPEMHRDFAAYVRGVYPHWVNDLIDGERPPLSVDVVDEFLLPVLEGGKRAIYIVVDCLRLDQWRVMEPLLSPMFEIDTTYYFSLLPTATPYSRNALFSGLFPGEIAARFPDWWGEREDETLNAHERELLEAHLEGAARRHAGALPQDLVGARFGRARAAPLERDRVRGNHGVRVQLRGPPHARPERVGHPVRGGA